MKVKDPSSLFLLYKYKFNCIFIFLEQECIQANFTCTLHLKRPEEGFLDKVIGIGEIAGPPGQAAPRPPPEGLEMAVEQTVERRLVSGPRAIDEVENVDSGSSAIGEYVARVHMLHPRASVSSLPDV